MDVLLRMGIRVELFSHWTILLLTIVFNCVKTISKMKIVLYINDLHCNKTRKGHLSTTTKEGKTQRVTYDMLAA